MASDGTGQTRLTSTPGTDAASRHSLDGSRIVFVSNRHNPADPNSDLDIYSMNPDGSDQTRITTGAALTAPPALGPGTPSDSPLPLADVTVSFFDKNTNKTIGGTALTNANGDYEKWLPPGNYYALVNSATASKPLGWNGHSPIWSKGQLFDLANGGDITYFDIPGPNTSIRYDQALPPLFPVTGRVLPQGGPGLGVEGKTGSYKAVSPFGQFWAVDLPQDGNYAYPLPNGQWKIIYVVPGYRNSYYHETEDFDQAEVITVAGAGVTLDDQRIYPE